MTKPVTDVSLGDVTVCNVTVGECVLCQDGYPIIKVTDKDGNVTAEVHEAFGITWRHPLTYTEKDRVYVGQRIGIALRPAPEEKPLWRQHDESAEL